MLPNDVRTLLRHQIGLGTRPQILACGYSDGVVDGWVTRRLLEPVFVSGVRMWGTYRAPGSAEPPEQQALAAALRCRWGARVSGPVNLGLLGVEGFTPEDPFVILVRSDRTVRNVPFPVVRDPLLTSEAAKIGGLPAVTATRSLVDAALSVRGKRLRVGVDSALWLGLTNIDRLRRCADSTCHEGAEHLRELIRSGVFDVESEGERHLRPLLSDFQPPPRWQYWLNSRIRVDCCLADVPLVIEYLGAIHRRGELRAIDHERDRAIRALGYHPEYVVKGDLAHPAMLRARILGARAALLTIGHAAR